MGKNTDLFPEFQGKVKLSVGIWKEAGRQPQVSLLTLVYIPIRTC